MMLHRTLGDLIRAKLHTPDAAALVASYMPLGSVVRLASDDQGHPGILLRTTYSEQQRRWLRLVAVGVSFRGMQRDPDGAIVIPAGLVLGEYVPIVWTIFDAHRVAWYDALDVEHLKSGPAVTSEDFRERLFGTLVGIRAQLASARSSSPVGEPASVEANPA